MNSETDFTLSESDVRPVVRLLADALAPDDGRGPKITRLMDGLGEMINADGWIWMRTRLDNNVEQPPSNIDFVMGGLFDEAALAEYADWSLEVYGPPPENLEVRRLNALRRPFTRTRGELVDDRTWSEPRCVEHVRRFGFDEFMYSFVPLVEQEDEAIVFSGAMLVRRIGRRGFSPRDGRLIHLVLCECGDLHTEGLNVELSQYVRRLTPRQHTVLTLLLDGQTPARAAANLRLSPHTVNGHIKAIYRHFGVQSRAELMRRFLQVDPDVGDAA